MATFINQETRLLTLATPLGDDVLLLTAFSGQETLSQLFTYQLEMVSEEEDIQPADIVGKNVTWGVQEWEKETRWFNGYVRAFSAGVTRLQDRRVYRMEVVPYLWFLTRTADCRIFQRQKTPDIIQRIFKDYGLKNYELQLKRSFPEWEYCVQYRETAFNFVSRLMEHEGIFYYFKHDNGKHILVLADHKGAYTEVADRPVDYSAGNLSPNHISTWEHRYAFRSGKWAHTDYNFKTPSTNLLTNTNTIIKLPRVDKFEIFDYPGAYPDKGIGKDDVKVRMEEEEARHDTVTASSGCPLFSPGFKFTLNAHEIEAETSKSYVLTSIHHEAADTSQGQSGEASEYRNSFTCIPAGVIFRPERRTPKPMVQGPQTAVVVGPAGEEIYTDEYGRIKVQFFWDRYGKRDENSSCWMRISQDWAGKGWGMLSIPRIGQEVIVDFLEGDPDQPIVTGRVYNAEQTVAYPLPAEKTKSYVKSNSTLGGVGFNEIRFEDKKGKEQIFVHAEKDQDVRVKNDRREWIGNDRSLIVKRDKMEHVENNKHIHVDKNHVEKIDQNMELAVGQNQDINVGQTKKEAIGQDSHLQVGSNRNVAVGSAYSLKVGSSQKVGVGKGYSLSVGEDLTESVGKSRTAQIGMNNNVVVGMNHAVEAGEQIGMTAGMQLVLQAGMRLTIQAPGGFIDIGPAGITIQGKMVKINSGGSPSQAMPATPGAPSPPTGPDSAKQAQPKDPDVADDSVTGSKSAP